MSGGLGWRLLLHVTLFIKTKQINKKEVFLAPCMGALSLPPSVSLRMCLAGQCKWHLAEMVPCQAMLCSSPALGLVFWGCPSLPEIACLL